MAAQHIDLGNYGEQLAVDFLLEQGCEILAQNHRWSRAEIDIIARTPAGLHFIEVKTRRWLDEERARAAVTAKKQANVQQAAGYYMEDRDYQGDFQFDIITVLVESNGNTRITWTQDAFGFGN